MKCFILFVVIFFFLGLLQAQNVDVDLFTGQPVMDVPIWTVTAGQLSHPIRLTYNSNGVRTGLGANKQFGLGWNFAFAGGIYREVRHLPDELLITSVQPHKYGWLHNNSAQEVLAFNPQGDDDLTDCSDEEADFEFLNSRGGFSLTQPIKDTEPDEFIISAPGLSCKFVFDNNGEIRTIPGTSLRIQKHLGDDGKIASFEVTTDQGVHYFFSSPEHGWLTAYGLEDPALLKRPYYSYKNLVGFNKLWRLIRMQSQEGDFIEFEYKNYDNVPVLADPLEIGIPISRTEEIRTIAFTSPDSEAHYTLDQPISRPTLPSKIVTKNHVVEFFVNDQLLSGADPEGIISGVYHLKYPVISGIRISSTFENTKTLLAHYSFNYFRTDTNLMQGGITGSNVVLGSIAETSSLTDFRPITFEYYGVEVNGEDAVVLCDEDSDDAYGFRGSMDSGGLIVFPSHIYPNQEGADRYRIDPIFGYSNDYFVLYGLSDLKVNEVPIASLQCGMLKKIIKAEGSFVRLLYEPNYYYDALSNYSFYAGGLRVKLVETYDGINPSNNITTHYDYMREDGQSSGILVYRPERTMILHFFKPTSGAIVYQEDLIAQGLSQNDVWKRLIRNGKYVLNGESNPGFYVGYERVITRQTGAGKTVYDFGIPIKYGTIQSGNWSASRSRIARDTPSGAAISDCSALAPLGKHYCYPFAPNPNTEYLQGDLLSVTRFNELGHPISRTENTYSIISQPAVVYAIKMDKFKSRAVIHTTINGVPTSGTSLVDMFVYSKYEIHTGAKKRLTKVKEYLYNTGNPSLFVTTEQNYNYDAPGHHYLRSTSVVNSNGIEKHTILRYPDDFIITSPMPQQDSYCKAITKLKEKNIRAIPIESYSYRKNGTTEIMEGASLKLFKYDTERDRVQLLREHSLSALVAKSAFAPASISMSQGNAAFHFNEVNYKNYLEQSDFDENNRARSVFHHTRRKSGTHLHFGVAPKATIDHAFASEVLFSDFESDSDFGFSFIASNWGNESPFGSGRIHGRAIKFFGGTQAKKILGSINKGNSAHNKFSCWINATGSGNLTIRVSSANVPAQIYNIPVQATNGNWIYVSQRIPVSAFGPVLNIEVESGVSLLLDDVMFQPSDSDVSHFLYNEKLEKLAVTTNGLSTTFSYDESGRITLTKDDDGNIRQHITYGLLEQDLENRLPLILVGDVFRNEPALFKARWFISPSVNYKWKITQSQASALDFSGAINVTGDQSLSHTFTTAGDWYVSLQVSYGNTVKTSKVHKITVHERPLNVSICANRSTLIDVCDPYGYDQTCTTLTSNGNVRLSGHVTGGSGNYAYQWQFQPTAKDAHGDPHIVGNTQVLLVDYSSLTIPSHYEAVNGSYRLVVTDVTTNQEGNAVVRFKTFNSGCTHQSE